MAAISIEDDVKAVRGEICLKLYRSGKLIDEYVEHNLVVDTGRQRLAELVTGKSNSIISQVGFGSGSDPEASSDTSLQEQILIPLRPIEDGGETTKVEGLDAIFYFTLEEHEAVGLSIRELGLFCDDGCMFSHRVRRGEIYKDSDIKIRGSWTLHF